MPCIDLNASDAKLCEHTAMVLVWLELSAKAVGMSLQQTLLHAREVGRADPLPYMQNLQRNVTYTIRWCNPSETDLAVLHCYSPSHEEQVVSVVPSSAWHPPRASLLQPLRLC